MVAGCELLSNCNIQMSELVEIVFICEYWISSNKFGKDNSFSNPLFPKICVSFRQYIFPNWVNILIKYKNPCFMCSSNQEFNIEVSK